MSNATFAKNYLVNYSKKVQPYIKKCFSKAEKQAKAVGKDSTKLLKDIETLSMGGKRVRGGLVTLGYLLGNKRLNSKILEASTFIEIFHTGVITQDDFMDQADTRRDQITIFKRYKDLAKRSKTKTDPDIYGAAIATCAGDIEIYLSWQILLNSSLEQKRIIKASQIYAEYIERLIYGQVQDLSNSVCERDPRQDKQNILKILKYKTAEYTCVLPLLVGATLGGVTNSSKIEAIKSYGQNFGCVYQVQDDILGMFEETEKSGKDSISDLREGKNTLLTHHFFQNLSKSEKISVKKYFGDKNATRTDLLQFRKLLIEKGSLQYIKKVRDDYAKKAFIAITKITKNKKLIQILSGLVDYIIEKSPV